VISKITKASYDIILCTDSGLVLGTGRMEIEAFGSGTADRI
jgi:hypothetical protein